MHPANPNWWSATAKESKHALYNALMNSSNFSSIFSRTSASEILCVCLRIDIVCTNYPIRCVCLCACARSFVKLHKVCANVLSWCANTAWIYHPASHLVHHKSSVYYHQNIDCEMASNEHHNIEHRVLLRFYYSLWNFNEILCRRIFYSKYFVFVFSNWRAFVSVSHEEEKESSGKTKGGKSPC